VHNPSCMMLGRSLHRPAKLLMEMTLVLSGCPSAVAVPACDWWSMSLSIPRMAISRSATSPDAGIPASKLGRSPSSAMLVMVVSAFAMCAPVASAAALRHRRQQAEVCGFRGDYDDININSGITFSGGAGDVIFRDVFVRLACWSEGPYVYSCVFIYFLVMFSFLYAYAPSPFSKAQ
jgi:hypothetical protein